MMRTRTIGAGLACLWLAVSLACDSPRRDGGGKDGAAGAPAAPTVDPTSGRSRITIYYSGNVWGELLECG